MAQTIKLKRSATTGKVPSTSNLALGELAVNTYDGRIFFKKNDGSDSIEHILTTDSITTGSITLTGEIKVSNTINIGNASNSTSTRVGEDALRRNESGGQHNTAVGYHALANNTSGDYSTAVGTDALSGSLSSGGVGGNNVGIGYQAGRYRHRHGDSYGAENVYVGSQAGRGKSQTEPGVGSENTAVGKAALINVTSGSHNTVVGKDSGFNITTGERNVFIGSSAGTDGNGTLGSIMIGYNAEPAGPNNTNEIVIGSGSAGNGSNTVTIGNSQITDNYFSGNIHGTFVGSVSSTNGLISGSSQIDVTATTNYSDVATISGTETLTNKTLTNPTINAVRLLQGSGNVLLDSKIFRDNAGSTDAHNYFGFNGDNVFQIYSGNYNTIVATNGVAQLRHNGGIKLQTHNDGIQLHSGLIIGTSGTLPVVTSIQASNDSFADNDTSLMTAASIDDRINAFAGSSNITTVGTIGTGTWNGSVIESAYLDADTAHLTGTQTFSGAKSFSSAVNIDSTTQSTSKTAGALIVDGGVGIAKTLNVGEDVVAYASSDERYKDLITPIENPNEKIKLLSGNTFVWNDKHEVFKGKKDIGVIAQEVEKVLPEIVETRDNGYKAVKYEKIVALLIESNKELLKRVEELESKLK